MRLREDPRGWIAQPVVQLSTVPTLVEDGLRPRHTDLRPFAVNDGESVFVLPGGLTRVALPEGELVVNSSQGGGSKDTWVLGGAVPRRAVRHQSDLPQAVAQDSAVPIDSNPNDVRAQVMQQQQQGRATTARRCPVLSRIAESLFWIGRYVERADDTARLLDVHVQILLEDPWAEEDLACRSLLSVMDRAAPPAHVEVGREYVLDMLAYDRFAPSSIAGSLVSARENARRAREIISTELWECLNATWNQLPSHMRPARPHDYFTWVRERAAIVAGIMDSATSRDDTWNFMVLGRSIERADMTARLLTTRALAGSAGPSWTTLLRSCGAHEAFLRMYRGSGVRRAGRRLPADRPAVPAVDRVRAQPGRGVPGEPRGHVRPGGRRRRAAAHRVRAHEPGVPPADRGPRRAAQGDGTGAARLLRGLGRDPRPVLPERVVDELGGGGAVSRLRVVHTSTFRYDSAVVASYNEARMTPLSQQGQTVLETRIDVQPHTGWHEYRDYWGTAVSAFEVLTPHESMVITAEHLVEVAERAPLRSPATWDTLRGAELRDRLAEFLSDTPTTAPPEDVVELAQRVAGDLEPADAALAVAAALRDEMEYIPGVTTVHTPGVGGVDRAGGGVPGHRAPRRGCAALPSGSRRGTSRATCTPTPRRPSARPCSVTRTRGSSGGWASGARTT